MMLYQKVVQGERERESTRHRKLVDPIVDKVDKFHPSMLGHLRSLPLTPCDPG